MRRTPLLAAALAALAVAPPASAATPKPCRYVAGQPSLLPFPNDRFTKRADTETGRRLAIRARCTPANADGKRFDVTELGRLDGWSPGTQLLVRVRGLSPRRSRIAPITDIGSSLRRRAPIAIVDTRTGERVAHWGELDAQASRPRNRLLMINPAENLVEGRRYVVVLRALRRKSGRRIGTARGLRRRKATRRLLRTARRAGVPTKRLHLVWDFTVGSEESIQRRLLHMRDSAFAGLGDTDTADDVVAGSAPAFSVDAVETFTAAQNPNVLRRVRGTVEVPCFLTESCAPGGTFALGADGLPQRQGTYRALFSCLVPRSAAGAVGRAALLGHGLLGDAEDQTSRGHPQLMAGEHNMTFCATDWAGMSTSDVPNIVTILRDLGRFPEVADRLQQGVLNFLFLGRAMRHPQGLVTHPAFRIGDRGAFDPSALYFDGNSQGGIFGTTLAAVAVDHHRSTLGVPGFRYSLLLPRSTDWTTYKAVFDPAYPGERRRPVALQLVQLLWDRADPSGWAHRLGSGRHDVLMQVMRGDHQVAPVAADALARTIGARTTATPFAPGVSDDEEPLWGIERIPAFPYRGSAIVYWEPFGGLARTPRQPLTNTDRHSGTDPHYDVRYTPAGRRQKSEFLRRDGAVLDVCGGTWCQAAEGSPR